MGKYKPYPEYKTLDAGWVNEIPAQWTGCALKRIASLKSGSFITAESIEYEGSYPVYGGNGLRGFTSDYTHEGKFPIIGRQGALCGNINYATGKFWASEHAVVVTSVIALDIFWLGELLRAMDLNQYSVSAAQPGLSVENVSNLRVPVPTHDEQKTIASFLDRESAKIDRLIAKQEELIALLKEKRQAVISQAVTKGLNPNVPMKDSGVEWLGEIPAHWKVSQLRYEIAPGTSITYGIVQAGPDVEGGIPYIRTSDMSGQTLPENGYLRTTPEIDRAYSRSKVYCGDIVVAIRATVGKCLPVPKHLDGANLTQGTAKISPGKGLGRDFLLLFMQSRNAELRFSQLAKGATFKEVTLEMLRCFNITIPPIEEQRMISSAVNSKLTSFDKLVESAQDVIRLLQERRTSLISAAVTGKIDVRNWHQEASA